MLVTSSRLTRRFKDRAGRELTIVVDDSNDSSYFCEVEVREGNNREAIAQFFVKEANDMLNVMSADGEPVAAVTCNAGNLLRCIQGLFA